MATQFLTVFLFTTVYAVIRYAGFGDVSLIHVPVYLMNKSICLAAAVSLFMASLCLVNAQLEAVRFWRKACMHLIFIHILLSLAILSKGYYSNFFDGDKMNLTGEAVLLMGVLAVYCFWRLGAPEVKPASRRALASLASILVAGHIFAMGYDGWLQVQKWHGGLPPITLLSFFLVTSGLILSMRVKDADITSSPDVIRTS